MRNKVPKILRIVNRFNLGGPTFNAAYLTKYLQPQFETKLIGGLKDDSEDSSEFIVRGLGLNCLIIEDMRRSIDLKKDWRAYRKISEIIKDFEPDIVHTHASKAGFLGRLAAIRQRVPVVVHTFHGHVFHSYFGKIKTFMYKTLERFLAKRSSMIIAISEEQKRELSQVHKICRADQIRVIRLGFELSKFQDDMPAKRIRFRSHYHLQDNDVAIGIVGRIVPVKNHPLFIQAFAEVRKRIKTPVKAFIIGDGADKKAMQELTGQLHLTCAEWPGTGLFAKSYSELHERPARKYDIMFTSWIREVDFVYAGMDIVCLTSLNEGTPVSLIEAQASGKAVVSTRVGGVENIISHGQSGLLCDVSLEKFTQNLIRLIENPDERETMGKDGIGRVAQAYHYKRLVRETGDLYFNLLSSSD